MTAPGVSVGGHGLIQQEAVFGVMECPRIMSTDWDV
jgi:hypothetical protein